MTTDLYLSKESQLAEWMRQRKYFSTHEVIKWGCDFYYNRSNRTKQDFWKKGLIRTLTDFEKHSRGFTCKDDCYEYIGKCVIRVSKKGEENER